MPPTDTAIRLLKDRFLNRTDKLALKMEWDSPCPAWPATRTGGTLDAVLLTHLLGNQAPEAKIRYKFGERSGCSLGRFRVGSYCPATDNTTKWICIDFDGAGHADALEDPLGAAWRTLTTFSERKLSTYLERSGGGAGYHLWAFFDPPIAAVKARKLALALVVKDAALVRGGVADPSSNSGIEIFPKQDKHHTKDGMGNLVWLPWWDGAVAGGNVFYRRNEAALEAYAPDTLDTCGEADVDSVLVEYTEEEKNQDDEEKVSEEKKTTTSSPEWKDWRQRAIIAVKLEDIYGSWLTGEKQGEGWLECRDPGSPSGDQNPSAGVSDGSGEAERGKFKSFRTGKCLSIFDFLCEHGGCRSFIEAARKIASLSGIPLPPPRIATTVAPEHDSNDGRPPPEKRPPLIQVNNRQLRAIVSDAWSAVLSSNNPPRLFRKSNAVVRLVTGMFGPIIDQMGQDEMFGYLTRIADWIKINAEGESSNVKPDRDAACDLTIFPHATLPVIDAVVFSPVFDSKGNIVSEPGYHPSSGLWYYRPDGFNLHPIADQPTDFNLRAACSMIIDELLYDFPFASSADLTNAVGALLLPFARRMIDGVTPIQLIEAPSPGTGKGLLADCISIIATGKSAEPTTVTDNEEELRKKITSLLIKAPTVILLDNVRSGLDSSQLSSALTAETWSDRTLGVSKMIDLPNRAVWIVTANNPTLSLEIARRCARIRLDRGCDKPWERDPSKYLHHPLRTWVKQNRAALVHACLTLIQAWISRGRKPGHVTLGSFEDWAATIGGILETAGIDGFLSNADELYEVADAEGNDWREFVSAWWQEYGEKGCYTHELFTVAKKQELLASVRGDGNHKSQMTRMGIALRAQRDRQYGNTTIRHDADPTNHRAVYRLQVATTVRNDDEV